MVGLIKSIGGKPAFVDKPKTMDTIPKTENRKPETDLSGREYLGLKSIIGPLLVVTGVRGVGFDESVEVTAPDGSRQTGRVLAVGQDEAVIELFGETVGLSLQKPGCVSPAAP